MNTLRATFKWMGVLGIISLGTIFSASAGSPGVVRGGGVGVAVGGGSGFAGSVRGLGVDGIPAEDIIYYVPRSEREPLPWRCNDQALLRQAIDESSLGHVPEQAPNVFYVSDAKADRLKREAKASPARLYYILEEEEPSFTLMSCPDQLLLRDLIRESGCKHVPRHAANVFYVNKEWKDALLSANASPMPLGFIVKGDVTATVLSSPNKKLVTQAILESGLEHVTGREANVFYIAASYEKAIRDDVNKNYGGIEYVPEGYRIVKMNPTTIDAYRFIKEKEFAFELDGVIQEGCSYHDELELWWAIYDSNLGPYLTHIYSGDNGRFDGSTIKDDYLWSKCRIYSITRTWSSILRRKERTKKEAEKVGPSAEESSSCCIQ